MVLLLFCFLISCVQVRSSMFFSTIFACIINDGLFVLTPICCVWCSCFIRVICIDVGILVYTFRWCSCTTTDPTNGAGTVSLSPVFSGVTKSSVFCVMFYDSLFVLLSVFSWPLYCMAFFELRLLISTLLSSCFFSQWENQYNLLFRKFSFSRWP